MRAKHTKRIMPILLLFLLALAWPVWSQESKDETEANIDTTVSVWGNHVVDDSSKAEEYGQVPEGFLINSFKVGVDMKSDRYLDMRGKNVGLNNGRYGFDYGVYGKYKLYIDYTKIPHLFSKSGETIWTELSPGVWRLPDSVQNAIQNLNPFDPVADNANYTTALRTLQYPFLKSLLANATPTPLGLQRNRGTVGFTYSPNTNWKYGVEYFREIRNGTRPFGTVFGFSLATELPEHIDYSTDRYRAGVEYTKKGKSFSIAYDLSLFRNEQETFTWDNPLRFTDRTYSSAYVNGDGTSQARVQLPTDNTANAISFAGATYAGKGRFSGNFSWSSWTDDVTLLPFTINSAIDLAPLQAQIPGGKFNGDVRNITANLRYTVPIGKGNLTAAYRLYDQSNNNDQFNIKEYVRLDQVVEEREETECDPVTNTCVPQEKALTPHLAFTYNTVDLDFRVPFSDRYHWYVGYSFNKRDLEGREINSTDINAFKTGLDITAAESVDLHLSYVYSQRRFDEFEIDNEVYLPIYTPLTRFDIADLNRNQFRFLSDFSLGEKSTLGASAVYWKNNYQDVVFGLQQARNWSIGADYSYAVTSGSTFNIWYEHQQNKTDQIGRQSTVSSTTGKPVTDAGFDWTVGLDNNYDTIGAGYLWNAKDEKWNWDTNITYARANGSADIFGASKVRPTGAVGFDNVDDTDLVSFKTGVTCKAFKHAHFAIWYYFDNYQIDDFAEDSIATDIIGPVLTPTGPTFPGTITLNAIQPNYTYHTGWVGFIYSW